jgi:hypothetical protein
LRQSSVPRYELVSDKQGAEGPTKLCETRGMRLPTIRELALIAGSEGAKGISLTPLPGYKLVKKAGDEFYYSSEGFLPMNIPQGFILISSTFARKFFDGFETKTHCFGLSPNGSIDMVGEASYVYHGFCVY